MSQKGRNRISFVMPLLAATTVKATEASSLIEIAMGDQIYNDSIQILLFLTVISLAPSILIMMTCFTRTIISLHFLKSALGTQQMPPSQVLVGLALFITFFVMNPVFEQVNVKALQPLKEGVITQAEAFESTSEIMKGFMLRQTRDEDLKLFMELGNKQSVSRPENMAKEIPLHIVVPAFIISELRAGFIIGFLIYIPFIVIDMVVASTLMSMGMMMLPPAMISLPFKILVFVLVDGWNLIVEQLILTIK